MLLTSDTPDCNLYEVYCNGFLQRQVMQANDEEGWIDLIMYEELSPGKFDRALDWAADAKCIWVLHRRYGKITLAKEPNVLTAAR